MHCVYIYMCVYSVLLSLLQWHIAPWPVDANAVEVSDSTQELTNDFLEHRTAEMPLGPIQEVLVELRHPLVQITKVGSVFWHFQHRPSFYE